MDRTNSINDPITKNKLALFRCPKPKAKTKQTKAFAMLKDNVELFSRLYIVAQSRGSDMHSFFKHENQPFPPSISAYGKLRPSKKSDLLHLLAKDQEAPPNFFDAIVFDGAAVVYLLPVSLMVLLSFISFLCL